MKRTATIIGMIFAILPLTFCGGDNVVFRVGDGYELTDEEFQAFYDAIPRHPNYYWMKAGGRPGFAYDVLLPEKLMIEAAEAKGLPDDLGVAWRIDSATELVYVRSHFDEVINSQVSVDPEEVRQYYDDHPEEFLEPEKVQVFTIHAAISPMGQELTGTREERKKDARKRILEVQRRLRNGEDFGELASEVSDDLASGANKGFAGLFAHDDLDPTMAEAVWDLPKNKVSDIVETEDGYYILKSGNRTEERMLSFSDERVRIEFRLKDERRAKIFHAYIDDLRAKANVEVDYEALKTFRHGEGADPAVADKVVMRVNDWSITGAQFAEAFKAFDELDQRKWAHEKNVDELIEKYIDYDILGRKLMMEEIRSLGKDSDVALTYQAELARDRILVDQVFSEEVESKVSYNEDDLKKYYESNKEDYTHPTRYRARHILAKAPAVPKTKKDQETDTKARAKIERLKKRVEGGADFAELAKTESEGPTAIRGGGLGWFPKGQMAEAFDKALEDMRPGELKGPVRTEFGYHLIQLEEVQPGFIDSFFDVRDKLKEAVEEEKRSERYNEYLAELKGRYAYHMKDEYFDQFADDVAKREAEQREALAEIRRKQAEIGAQRMAEQEALGKQGEDSDRSGRQGFQGDGPQILRPTMDSADNTKTQAEATDSE